MSTDLFAPYQLGDLELKNRFVMAPMTRNRAGEGTAPTALNAEYYAQRAGAGLIITEGTQPAAVGQGYPGTPGLHTDAQVAGWRLVADAVHAQGGAIFAQLMHTGRIGHPSITGLQPVGPSPIAAAGQVFTPEGMQDMVVPRELPTAEIADVVAGFVDASQRAVAAGLDGVELHAANGYLLHQFLADGSNTRTDAYGGSPEARARLVVEVAAAGCRPATASTTSPRPRSRRPTRRWSPASSRSAWSTCTSRRTRARATPSPCASCSPARSSAAPASRARPTSPPPRRSSTPGPATCSRSGAASSPTRTWSPATGPAPRSTSPTRPPSTPGTPRATPTTRR
jgi:hypothetical protein